MQTTIIEAADLAEEYADLAAQAARDVHALAMHPGVWVGKKETVRAIARLLEDASKHLESLSEWLADDDEDDEDN